MRFLIATTSAIALMGAIATASAEEVRGVVKSIDEAKNQITTMGGDVFALGMKPFAGALTPGDVVDITWYGHEKGYKKAFDVDVVLSAEESMKLKDKTIPQGQTTRGVVKSIDEAKNTITLLNGDVYAVGVSPHSSELIPGDVVQVKWYSFDTGGYRRAYKLERLYPIAVDKSNRPFAYWTTTGSEVSGKITDIDPTRNLITLNNGAIFALDTSVTDKHAASLEKGQKVVLDWDRWHNGYRLANEIKVIEN